MKKMLSVLLVVVLVLAMAVTAMAAQANTITATTPAANALVPDGTVDFDDLLDTLEPSTPEVEDVTITSAPSAVECTVEGQTVTINHTEACVVGYLDGENYVAIAATANGDGTYSFEAPEGVTEVVVGVKGDANGNGTLDAGDCTRAKAVMLGKTTLDAKATFFADANGNGSLDAGDCTRAKAAMLGKTNIAW